MLSAAARFGLGTALIGKVGCDMHGQFLKQTLDDVGVGTDGLVVDDSVFTTLAFVALHNGEREFSFARKPGADTCLRSDEIKTDILDNTKIFHVGSLSLTDEPSRAATIFALEHAKQSGAIISYDPNYRASLWRSPQAASEQMRSIVPYVNIMKLSDEETELLTGISDPHEAAVSLIGAGITCVAVTLGKDGALVCIGNTSRTVAGFDIPGIDTTGAGDAFWGGFLYRLLQSGKELKDVTLEDAAQFARFANATATVCVTRRGGIPAMPTLDEVRRILPE